MRALLLLAALGAAAGQVEECPRRCDCLGHLVDCSKRGLARIPPDVPSWTRTLELQGNQIANLSDSVLPLLPHLEKLDMSRNGLGDLEPGFFASFRSLQTLKLRGNKLQRVAPGFGRLSNLTQLDLRDNDIRLVEADTLRPLVQLEILDLGKNALTSWPSLQPTLTALKELHLDGNRIGALEVETLAKLSQLEVLRLARNRIPALPKDAFRDLTQLTILDLSRNSIRAIEGAGFGGLGQLRVLRLARNGIQSLGDGAFWGLESLQELNLKGNAIPAIRNGWLYGLPNLTKLNLAGNKVKSIESDGWNYVPALQELNLADNSLLSLQPQAFALLSQLLELDLSGNGLRRFSNTTFSGLSMLQTLDLSSNALSAVLEDKSQPFLGLRGLTHLNLSTNGLQTLSQKAFKVLRFPFANRDLSSNALSAVLEDKSQPFLGLRGLTHLNLSTNGLQTLSQKAFKVLRFPFANRDLSSNALSAVLEDKSQPFLGLRGLTHLNLSTNGLQTLSQKAFKVLRFPFANRDLSSNALSAVLEDKSQPFLGLRGLTHLNLSTNGLQTLSQKAFKVLRFPFANRDLSSNALSAVLEDKSQPFLGLRGLTHLNLSTNGLQTLSQKAFKVLRFPFANRDLSSNALSAVLEDKSQPFLGLRGLTHLNLSTNGLQTLSQKAFKVLRFPFANRDLSSNALSAVLEDKSQPFLGLRGLTHLNLSTNGLQTLSQKAFKVLRFPFANRDLSSNALSAVLEDKSQPFLGLRGLTHLNLSTNGLQTLSQKAFKVLRFPFANRDLSSNALSAVLEDKSQPFLGLRGLTHLNLSTNGLQTLSQKAFKVLRFPFANRDLSSNALSAVLEDKSQPFLGLRGLTHLNLSTNGLQTLSQKAFKVLRFPFANRDLSSNALSAVLEDKSQPFLGLRGLTHLNLSTNGLQTLSQKAFKVLRFPFANRDLSSNALSAVLEDKSQPFLGLRGLTHLNLSTNGLQTLSQKAFKLLRFPFANRDLSSNALSAVLEDKSQPFLGLRGLTHLNLSTNGLQTLSQKAFKVLRFPFANRDLSSNALSAVLEDKSQPFLGLRGLTHLNLSTNGLQTLSQKAFKVLRFPFANRDLSSNALSAVLEDKSQPFLGLRGLTHLNLSTNGLQTLSQKAFKVLRFPFANRDLSSNALSAVLEDKSQPFLGLRGLTHLNLSTNGLQTLSQKAFKVLRFPFANRDLSSNALSAVLEDKSQPFLGLRGLTHLNLSTNGLQTLSQKAFKVLRFPFANRDLSSNALSAVLEDKSQPFLGLRGLTHLNLSTNGLQTLSQKAFKVLRFPFANRDLSSNALSAVLEDKSQPFLGLRGLTHLNLSTNGLQTLSQKAFKVLRFPFANRDLSSNALSAVLEDKSQPFLGLRGLTHLNLSTNGLQTLSQKAFKVLRFPFANRDLSSNALSAVLEDKSQPFLGLRGLTHLNLSTNGLQTLSQKAFKVLRFPFANRDLSSNALSAVLEDKSQPFLGLRGLTHLNLSTSGLQTLSQKAFKSVSKVNVLDLSGNPLASLSEETFRPLRALTTLRMSTSMLVCDCSLDWLEGWLKEQSLALDSDSLICHHPPALLGTPLLSLPSSNLTCSDSPKPRLSLEPEDVTGLTGANASFVCAATASAGHDISVTWKRNGRVAHAEPDSLEIDNALFEDGAVSELTSTLRVLNLRQDDADSEWQCVLGNRYGSAYSRRALLQVHVFPSFLKRPANVSVAAGQNARLDCAALGYPPPVISWSKDGGMEVPAAVERRMHVLPSDDVFFIVDAKAEDAGLYTCTAASDSGTVTASAWLRVQERPGFQNPGSDVTVRDGETAVLKCLAAGAPAPSVRWLRNGRDLIASPRYELTAGDQLLVILHVAVEDAGVYQCEISNDLGLRRRTLRLNVLQGFGDETAKYGPSFPATETPDGDDFSVLPYPFSKPVAIALIAIACILGTSLVWLLLLWLCFRRRGKKERAGGDTGITEAPLLAAPVTGTLPAPDLLNASWAPSSRCVDYPLQASFRSTSGSYDAGNRRRQRRVTRTPSLRRLQACLSPPSPPLSADEAVEGSPHLHRRHPPASLPRETETTGLMTVPETMPGLMTVTEAATASLDSGVPDDGMSEFGRNGLRRPSPGQSPGILSSPEPGQTDPGLTNTPGLSPDIGPSEEATEPMLHRFGSGVRQDPFGPSLA